MKKALSLLLTAFLLAASLSSFALAAPDQTKLPALVITEIVPNTSCPLDGSGKDAFEYIELCNMSSDAVSLYDYSLLYNSNSDKQDYAVKKTNIVPGQTSTSLVDTALTPSNPETASIASGEIVVLWMWNFDSYKVAATPADFRDFWGIDDKIAVYIVDADNTEDTGNPLRFNCANKDQKTYYLAPADYSLDDQSNDNVICYAKWRGDEMISGSAATDVASVYIYNVEGADKRQVIFASEDDPTPGTLTDEQIASFTSGGAILSGKQEETTVPETTLPETTVPETTVPDTSAPGTNAPETSAVTAAETDETTTEGGKDGGSTTTYIIIGIVAAVAIVAVIIVVFVKSKKKK